jgi:L-threonate 2-dehydrogenase
MPTAEPTGTTRVAFLGLGAMGLPMASNLVEAGFAVAGFDVRPERSAALAAAGGQAASTPAEAAIGAQVVAAIPFDAAQERQALLGPGGALETMPTGGLVILMATIGPAALRELASEITARGYRVVDAPVTGGAAGAIAGTLTVIASGSSADLEAATPFLKPMSGQIFHVGTEPGQGQMIKLVNQLLVGTHLAAAAEAMALARAAGADLQQVYDLLITGQARSQMFVSRVGAMLDGGFNTGSSLRIFTEKDMPLVLNAGRELGVPMVTASAALQTMQLAAAFGLEDASDARLIQLLADPLGVAAEQAAIRDQQSTQ